MRFNVLYVRNGRMHSKRKTSKSTMGGFHFKSGNQQVANFAFPPPFIRYLHPHPVKEGESGFYHANHSPTQPHPHTYTHNHAPESAQHASLNHALFLFPRPVTTYTRTHAHTHTHQKCSSTLGRWLRWPVYLE